jgi:hypothetical protein
MQPEDQFGTVDRLGISAAAGRQEQNERSRGHWKNSVTFKRTNESRHRWAAIGERRIEDASLSSEPVVIPGTRA